MGLIDWMFAGFREKRSPAKQELQPDQANEWLEVEGELYLNKCVSANGMHLLAWKDSHDEIGRQGQRRTIAGRYLLRRNNKVILHEKMTRPSLGKVANNGAFVLVDLMGHGGGLRGKLKVFDSGGAVQFEHLFSAIPFSTGLSDDGAFAVCQTCNSNSDDGNSLSFFDVSARGLVWKIHPPTGWADSYRIDSASRRFYCHYRNLGDFAYDFSGQFLDEPKWRAARLEKGTLWEVIGAVNDELAEARSLGRIQEPEKLMSALNRVKTDTSNIRADSQAKIERAIAEVHDVQGQSVEAIVHYENAIELDPKIGVKRRLESLRKAVVKT